MELQKQMTATRIDSCLSEYIDTVRGICSGGFSLPAKVRHISDAARRLIAKPLTLNADLRYIPPHAYGRNLVYRDPDHGFVVIAMVWPPNTIGSPHDHMTWGVVAVSEGSIRICNFQREDDGTNKEFAKLHEIVRIDGKPGDVGHVLPPHEDIHSISNLSPTEPALSIHTYGRDIKRCRVFNAQTGKIDFADLDYHKSMLS